MTARVGGYTCCHLYQRIDGHTLHTVCTLDNDDMQSSKRRVPIANFYLKCFNLFILFRLMFTALEFLFVKCASGNCQSLRGAKNKSHLWRTARSEICYGGVFKQILRRDRPWGRLFRISSSCSQHHNRSLSLRQWDIIYLQLPESSRFTGVTKLK